MSARPRGLDLRAEADAAVDGGDRSRASLGDGLQLVDDLARQLAGRGEDQGAEVPRAGLDAVDQRHAEGERLARAGRGLDEQVVAGERVADDHLLDGERLGDAARESARTTGLETPRSANDIIDVLLVSE